MDAIASSAFANAVGINIHPTWRRTLWGAADWQSALLETGVSNVRGEIASGSAGQESLGKMQRLFARGIKLCALVAPHARHFDLRQIGANIAFLANHVGAANLCAIESANEYDAPSLEAPDWATQLRHFQSWLYEVVRANHRLDGVPVIGPSIWNRLTADIVKLGSLEPYLDASCMHYYTGGLRPSLALKPGNAHPITGPATYTLADAVREARTQGPSKPLYVTEFGYTVASAGSAPNSVSVSEKAAAKYLLRGLFDLFAAGARMMFIYSLIDDVQRAVPTHYGLLDGALNRRRSFFALSNLMSLVRDSASPSHPRPLPLAISADAPVRTTLMEKSDGSYVLVMYQDVSSYDRAAKRDLDVAPLAVTVALPGRAESVQAYMPTMSRSVAERFGSTQKFTVPVADHVTVVSITR